MSGSAYYKKEMNQDVHDDTVSKLLQIVIWYIFYDLRDRDAGPGQNLPNTSPGSAPVQASSLKLSGYLQKYILREVKKFQSSSCYSL